MSRRPHRNHSPVFKTQFALAAIRGDKTFAELARQFDVDANQITIWRDQALDGMNQTFSADAKSPEQVIDVRRFTPI